MDMVFWSGIWPAAHNFTRPIACYQLKHWIAKFGFSSQVVEYCQLLSGAELIEATEPFITLHTKAIGISTSFFPVDRRIPDCIAEALAHFRTKFPHLKIIAGGARASQFPDGVFDKMFSGDSENTLVDWLQIESGKTGRSVFNKKFNIVESDHRFQTSDAILPQEVLPIELGRGCIFKCKFCGHQNIGKAKNTYQRSHECLVAEMKWNYENFRTTSYLFLDDTVNEDYDKVVRLSCLEDDLGFSIQWTGYLRADLVWSKNEAELLQQSGMKSCFFGIETFHAQAAKSIDKGWSAKHGKEFLPHLYTDLWDSKINMHCNFIVGLPHESVASIMDSFDWCMQNDIGSHRFNTLTLYKEKFDTSHESEFTRNYLDYGYRNVKSDTFYWENDHMNSDVALALCDDLNAELRHSVNRASSWWMFGALNQGHELFVVRQWSQPTLLEQMERRREQFKFAYLNRLKRTLCSTT